MSNTNTYDEIISNLCVGNYKSVDDYSKFSLIVICMHNNHCQADNFPPSFREALPSPENRSFLPSASRMSGTPNIIHIPVHDCPDECIKFLNLLHKTRVLDRMHQFITNNQPVLVLCQAGMQRSCAVVVCYLMKHHHMTMRDAMDHVRSKRPIAFFGGANFQGALEWLQQREPTVPL